MQALQTLRHPGVACAVAAALLFGVATPLAKVLLDLVNPWLMAGLLYLGAGLGMMLWRTLMRAPAVRLEAVEWPWLVAAIVCGGVLAPVLLMLGLRNTAAAEVSLLLNAEAVFTSLLAWGVFKEHIDRRIALGMLLIVAGALVLTGVGSFDQATLWPTLAVLAACLAWAVDNNLTRKLSRIDASWIVASKGSLAGAVNLLIAVGLGAELPPWFEALCALTVGFVAYGLSLVLFVWALRQLGTARTGAYFALAPFFGVLLALVLGEAPTLSLLAAGLLMAAGVWLHLGERHAHVHTHLPLEHDHPHHHLDGHHLHAHDPPVDAATVHRHRHRHGLLSHQHPHYPDLHHRHRHPPL